MKDHRKNIPIEREIHHALKKYSVESGIPMKTIIEDYIKALIKGGNANEYVSKSADRRLAQMDR
jgi:hypothetical protein